jgi:hypothetical protein
MLHQNPVSANACPHLQRRAHRPLTYLPPTSLSVHTFGDCDTMRSHPSISLSSLPVRILLKPSALTLCFATSVYRAFPSSFPPSIPRLFTCDTSDTCGSRGHLKSHPPHLTSPQPSESSLVTSFVPFRQHGQRVHSPLPHQHG